jgi:endonuclease YncB( thermonuclease family)
MGVGVLTVLATTGAAGFIGGADRHEPGDARSDVAVHRGDDFEVTVRSVSDVDSFEGSEPATGLSFHAKVAGIDQIAQCWPEESRAVAEKLLLGKTVWLTVKKDGISGDDEIAVDVRLPDGADYGQVVVHGGMATADMSTRGELLSVEAAARVERRGVWAASCAPGAVTPTSSSAPSSTTTTAPTTTTTTTTPPPATETSEEPPPPPSSSLDRPPLNDDEEEWIGARQGKLCFIEGARRTSPGGTVLICARNNNNVLRWRRAD